MVISVLDIVVEELKIVNAELSLDLEVFKRAYKKEIKKDPRHGGTGKKGVRFEYEKGALSDQEIEVVIYEKIIKMKEKEMNKAVKELDFETAAILRDEIIVLKNKTDK